MSTNNPAVIAVTLTVVIALAPLWVPIDLTLKALGRRKFKPSEPREVDPREFQHITYRGIGLAASASDPRIRWVRQ